MNYEEMLRKTLALKENKKIEDIRCVWFCKTLDHAKGLYIDLETNDYYEITFNGHLKQVYIDTYEKKSNVVINWKKGGNNRE